MPEGIVDPFEVIEVEVEQRGGSAVERLSSPQRVADPVRDQDAVREACERIVESPVSEELLEVAALGHVAHRDDDAPDSRFVDEVGHLDLDLMRGTCRVPDLRLDRVARARPGRRGLEKREHERPALGLEQGVDPDSGEALGGPADESHHGRGHVGDDPLRIDHRDHVLRVLDDRLEPSRDPGTIREEASVLPGRLDLAHQDQGADGNRSHDDHPQRGSLHLRGEDEEAIDAGQRDVRQERDRASRLHRRARVPVGEHAASLDEARQAHRHPAREPARIHPTDASPVGIFEREPGERQVGDDVEGEADRQQGEGGSGDADEPVHECCRERGQQEQVTDRVGERNERLETGPCRRDGLENEPPDERARRHEDDREVAGRATGILGPFSSEGENANKEEGVETEIADIGNRRERADPENGLEEEPRHVAEGIRRKGKSDHQPCATRRARRGVPGGTQAERDDEHSQRDVRGVADHQLEIGASPAEHLPAEVEDAVANHERGEEDVDPQAPGAATVVASWLSGFASGRHQGRARCARWPRDPASACCPPFRRPYIRTRASTSARLAAGAPADPRAPMSNTDRRRMTFVAGWPASGWRCPRAVRPPPGEASAASTRAGVGGRHPNRSRSSGCRR